MGSRFFLPVCFLLSDIISLGRLFLFRYEGLAIELLGHPEVQPN